MTLYSKYNIQVLRIVTLYSKYTRALTFENLRQKVRWSQEQLRLTQHLPLNVSANSVRREGEKEGEGAGGVGGGGGEGFCMCIYLDKHVHRDSRVDVLARTV